MSGELINFSPSAIIMSEKTSSLYVCRNCDAQFPKWSGRCLECGAWGTLDKQVIDSNESRGHIKDQSKNYLKGVAPAAVIDLGKMPDLKLERLATKITEVDRVFGGGLVPGSLSLLSGEPGIGKSTLVAQIADALARNYQKPILYISGEESAAQVKNRLERLGCNLEHLKFISEINIEKILSAIISLKPQLAIVDSIQTIYSSLMPSEAGSLNQIRACAVKFLELAKTYNIPVFLIGHITKDGQIAGPKSLEHIVDTVVYLEQENVNNYSLIRVAKNRFGSVNEVGVLEMTGTGFVEVKNPATAFLENDQSAVAGSVISCVLEGSRPFLVDFQALVTKTIFGYPQRKASGFDLNRLQVLTAVLSKRQKVNLLTQDVILNIVGGLKINDPALDLAVCLAMISSLLNQVVSRQMIVLGEVGLGGEVRPVAKLEMRLKEAEKLGFESAVIPVGGSDKLTVKKIKLIKVKNMAELVEKVIKK